MKRRKMYKILYKHYQERSDALQREVNRLHAILKKNGIRAEVEDKDGRTEE